MIINNISPPNSPALNRLKRKQLSFSEEIKQLNNELSALKNRIRYKQKDLRKVNRDIVTIMSHESFLHIVYSSPSSTSKKQLPTHKKKVTLACLQGGRCSCK